MKPTTPEPCPGYAHFLEMTKKFGDVHGGLTVVAPNGKYIYVPFSLALAQNILDHPEYLKEFLTRAAVDAANAMEMLK